MAEPGGSSQHPGAQVADEEGERAFPKLRTARSRLQQRPPGSQGPRRSDPGPQPAPSPCSPRAPLGPDAHTGAGAVSPRREGSSRAGSPLLEGSGGAQSRGDPGQDGMQSNQKPLSLVRGALPRADLWASGWPQGRLTSCPHPEAWGPFQPLLCTLPHGRMGAREVREGKGQGRKGPKGQGSGSDRAREDKGQGGHGSGKSEFREGKGQRGQGSGRQRSERAEGESQGGQRLGRVEVR